MLFCNNQIRIPFTGIWITTSSFTKQVDDEEFKFYNNLIDTITRQGGSANASFGPFRLYTLTTINKSKLYRTVYTFRNWS